MAEETADLIAQLRELAYRIEAEMGDESADHVWATIAELEHIAGRPAPSRDPFDVIGEIPQGSIYQWCALMVFGEEVAPLHGRWLENGWTFVPPERHPEMSAEGGKIVFGGQALMEQSKEYVEAARLEELKKPEMMIRAWAKHVREIEMPSGFTPISGYGTFAGKIFDIEERKDEDE